MNELDRLYSPSFYSKRFSSPEEVIKHHTKFVKDASDEVRKTLPCHLNIPYGQSGKEKIDIFGVDLEDDAPIFVFIHGGYWQMKEIERQTYEFIAKNLHQNNIKSIFIGYELCPDVTILEIIQEIETAAKKCVEYAKQKGSKGVHFSGHSAGAHLVACLFTNFIKSLPEEDQSLIKSAILISGVFDLLPLQKTIINEPLNMDEGIALKASPARQNLSKGAETVVYTIVGAEESPEFIKQSKEFNNKLEDSGFLANFCIFTDVDHFDIIEKLSEEEFELTKCIIGIINDKNFNILSL